MKGFQYEKYDGLGLAQLIKDGEITVKELINVVIDKIEAINPELNAIIYKRYEKVIEEAKHGNNGVFSGVPMVLKGISQEVKGEPISSGSRSLQKYIPSNDAEYVKRIRNSGALFIGQTNVPEFALMATTEPAFFGASKNPWNLQYTPGGSSGGSATAVASGMVPIGGASDGGGSIRIPAAYCGLFGLKPTRGRTPVGPKFGRFWQGASVEHVLTRSVRDSAAMLDILKGEEKAGAFIAPPFNQNYLDIIENPINEKMKIAFSVESPIHTDVHEECKKAVFNTVKFLESQGHHLVEVNAPVDGKKIANSYMNLYFGEVSAAISNLEEILGRKAKFNDVEPTTWLLHLLGKATSSQDFVLSLQEWDKAAFEMETFHETYDFYITPTTAFPPAKIGEHDVKGIEKVALEATGRMGSAKLLKKLGVVDQLIEDSLKRVPFTQLANLTGQPAMSVPLHITNEGLPVGVQFIAARGRDDLLFRMAATLETTNLWTNIEDNQYFQLEG